MNSLNAPIADINNLELKANLFDVVIVIRKTIEHRVNQFLIFSLLYFISILVAN